MDDVVELRVNRDVVQIGSVTGGTLAIGNASMGTLSRTPRGVVETAHIGTVSTATFRLVAGETTGRYLALQEQRHGQP